MKRYPVFLNLRGKKAVVFGAGKVALRKVRDLLQGGAVVEVASRDFLPSFEELAKKNTRLHLKKKKTVKSLINGADLVFVATSDASFNRNLASVCRKKKIFVNVADRPDLCDFFVPSHLKKGNLEMAISTGGASPLLARKFREELSRKIRPEAIRLLGKMGRLREKVKTRMPDPKKRRSFFKKQIQRDFRFLKETGDSR